MTDTNTQRLQPGSAFLFLFSTGIWPKVIITVSVVFKLPLNSNVWCLIFKLLLDTD